VRNIKRFTCIECGNTFDEKYMKITEFGSGAVLSKVELVTCNVCDSTVIRDEETGKVQKLF